MNSNVFAPHQSITVSGLPGWTAASASPTLSGRVRVHPPVPPSVCPSVGRSALPESLEYIRSVRLRRRRLQCALLFLGVTFPTVVPDLLRSHVTHRCLNLPSYRLARMQTFLVRAPCTVARPPGTNLSAETRPDSHHSVFLPSTITGRT